MDTQFFQAVKERLYTYQYLGVEFLANGTELIGKVPHIAPQAWFHALFPVLIEEDITKIEEKIGVLPLAYRNFLLHCGNGISVFNGSLTLDGLRKIPGRTLEAAWQPFSITTPNTIERPKGLNSEYTIIGGYDYDDSKIILSNKDSKVYYSRRRESTFIRTWDSLEEFLTSEVERLANHFDKEGRRIDKSVPVIPISGKSA